MRNVNFGSEARRLDSLLHGRNQGTRGLSSSLQGIGELQHPSLYSLWDPGREGTEGVTKEGVELFGRPLPSAVSPTSSECSTGSQRGVVVREDLVASGRDALRRMFSSRRWRTRAKGKSETLSPRPRYLLHLLVSIVRDGDMEETPSHFSRGLNSSLNWLEGRRGSNRSSFNSIFVSFSTSRANFVLTAFLRRFSQDGSSSSARIAPYLSLHQMKHLVLSTGFRQVHSSGLSFERITPSKGTGGEVSTLKIHSLTLTNPDTSDFSGLFSRLSPTHLVLCRPQGERSIFDHAIGELVSSFRFVASFSSPS